MINRRMRVSRGATLRCFKHLLVGLFALSTLLICETRAALKTSTSLNVNSSSTARINKNETVKHLSKRGSLFGESESNTQTIFNVLRKDLIDGLEKMQSSMAKRGLECMPGSVFYNGTCIFIASKRQKLSWIHAERFCRRLPLNTTFLVLQNDHKAEFIRRELAKIREKEKPTDPLLFYIGFRYIKNEWKWSNNVSLTKTSNLSLGKYWWDRWGSNGHCGSLVLTNENKIEMKSAPCVSSSSRFMCEYNLNPCYMNNICGTRGQCVNLYYKFYCDCSQSFFWEGKYCEKLNYKGIQVIIGLVIVIVMTLGIFCNSSFFLNIWNYYFSKEAARERERMRQLREQQKLEQQKDELEKKEAGVVKFASVSAKQQNSVKWISLNGQLKKLFSKILNHKNIGYCVLSISTTILVVAQILFIHNLHGLDYIQDTKKSKFINSTCQFLEEYYMFEDLIYLPFSLLFLLVLYIFLKSRRFNSFIMIKFKEYFKSSLYKTIQNQLRLERKEKVKKKEEQLRRKTCGECRYFSYKCCTQKFCSCFCCLFCCSCCVPPGSQTRCFFWYCCCLGWRQTDFYKVLNVLWTVFKYFFYYFFCIPVWKCLWNLTKKATQKKKAKKRANSVRNNSKNVRSDFGQGDDVLSDNSTDIDQDDDFDEDDYNIETQSFNRNPCPFPSTPFSTSNRAQSAAVYIIYTYDVLNIFMFVFTGNYLSSSTYIPFVGQVGKASGILVELVIQFLQVVLIGIKFYPILVVADAEPHIIIYLFSTIYMLFIWLSWFIKKSFCSRSEAFIKQAFKRASSELGNRIKASFNLKRNITDSLLGFVTDEDSTSEKYLKALKEKVPNVFREFFGKYDESESDRLLLSPSSDTDLLLYGEAGLGLSSNGFTQSTISDYYYLNNNNNNNNNLPFLQSSTFTSTTTLRLSTTSYSLKNMFKNKTLGTLKEFYYQREELFIELVSILENLPLYITLSYLLMRYGLLFFDSLVSLCWNRVFNREKKESEEEEEEEKVNNSFGNNNHRITEKNADHVIYDRMISRLDKSYKEKNKITARISDKKNHNYEYIRNLLQGIDLYDLRARSEREKAGLYAQNNKSRTFVWNLIQTKIYKHVPYMKYSKQFINTYTVAFMVVYFFTLFGFRLSNLFGNALIGTVEMFYKLIFRSLMPKQIDMNEHNLNTEFRAACLLTSLITIFQLLSSIKSFHNDLIKLNKGEKFFRSLILKYKDDDYSTVIKKRNKASSTITSDSLHFPGYLIAHLVYGYAILFMVIFSVLLFSKLFFYLPGVSQSVLQILLPLFILFAFKFVFVNYLVKTVFLRDDSQRITNLAPYYVISYFSFFFDCFLGLVACVSRVWQTTIISLIRLPRLDKSMFNREDDLLMRRLDKGHLAYLNYVRMEHWYNNPVLNGFCEMLIESMLYSQIYRAKYKAMTLSYVLIAKKDSASGGKLEMLKIEKHPSLKNQYSITRIVTLQPSKVDVKNENRKLLRKATIDNAPITEAIQTFETTNDRFLDENDYYNTVKYDHDDEINSRKENKKRYDDGDHDDEEDNESNASSNASSFSTAKHNKQGNDNFKFESFLRLRNIFYLCLMLKKNPSLRMYRRHYLEEIRRREAAQLHKVQTSAQFFSENFERLLAKIKLKNSSTGSRKANKHYETSTTNTNANETDDELANSERVHFNLNSIEPNQNRNGRNRRNVNEYTRPIRKRNSSH